MKFSAYQVTRVMLASIGVGLFAIGAVSALRGPEIYRVYAGIFFADSFAMFYCNRLIGRKKKSSYRICFALLLVHAILPIFDQFGIADALFMAIILLTLTVLFLARKEFQSIETTH